jgi:hypothetical protein
MIANSDNGTNKRRNPQFVLALAAMCEHAVNFVLHMPEVGITHRENGASLDS